MPLILRTFLERENLTISAAAERFDFPLSTLKGYLRGNPLTPAACNKLLPHLGVATLEEGALRYDHVNERVQLFSDFARQSEAIFLAHFSEAREVRETRILLSAYSPPPPNRMQYRSLLNRLMYDRLVSKTIKVQKIEQINKLERAVDLIHNIRTFDHDCYDVRTLPRTEAVFPYVQFSIADRRSVMIGGFHADKGPPYDPFMSYVGSRFADFYMTIWERLRDYSNPFSSLPEREMLDIVIGELRSTRINGQEAYPGLTKRAFEKRVAERAAYVSDYATRY